MHPRTLKQVVFIAVFLLLPHSLLAALPRVSQDPSKNCETLLSHFKSITLRMAHRYPVESLKELKIMTYNMRNLFSIAQKFDQFDIQDPVVQAKFRELITMPGKSEAEVRGNAQVIQDGAPDLFVGQEIDGAQMWKSFSRMLSEKYYAYLQQESSLRKSTSIVKDIGFLFRMNLPLKFRYFSHRHLSYRDPETGVLYPLYPRDLPVIEIRKNDAQENSKPGLIWISCHMKSLKAREGFKNDREFRKAQFEGVSDMIRELRGKYGEDLPIVIAGDMNIPVSPQSGDMRSLFEESHMVNPFDLPQFENRDRVTHMHFFTNGDPPLKQQLDAILVSQSLVSRVKDIRVIPHRDLRTKEIKPLPRSHEEKNKDYSDHLAVRLVLDTRSLF